jgi:hypothetical protein
MAAHPAKTNVLFSGVIYWINPTGLRNPYTSAAIYNEWNADNFSQVLKANCADMSLPQGPAVPVKP